MRKWPTPQQHGIYGTENRRVRPNAQTEDGHGHKGKTGRFSQQAQTIENVSPCGLTPAAETQLAAFFFDPFNAAKGDLRLSPSLFLRHAGSQVFLKLQFDVELQFASELRLETTSAENSFELHNSPSEARGVTHCPAPVRWRPTFCATLKVPLPVESGQSE